MRLRALVRLEFLLVGVAMAGATALAQSEPSPGASRFVLSRTLMAPVGASGLAEFGGSAGGVTTLWVKTQNLGRGFYWLMVVRKADGATLRVAPLGVPDPDFQSDRQAGDDPNQRNSTHQSQPLGTESTVTFASAWNPADIASLVITDLNDNPLLVGHPAGPSPPNPSATGDDVSHP